LRCSLVNSWVGPTNQRSTLAAIRGTMNPDKPRNRSKFLLRLPKSVSDAAKLVAGQEGVSLNQFISLAVAEKIIRVEQSTSPTITSRSEKEGRLPGPGHPAE
jgi:hypothetical protein